MLKANICPFRKIFVLALEASVPLTLLKVQTGIYKIKLFGHNHIKKKERFLLLYYVNKKVFMIAVYNSCIN